MQYPQGELLRQKFLLPSAFSARDLLVLGYTCESFNAKKRPNERAIANLPVAPNFLKLNLNCESARIFGFRAFFPSLELFEYRGCRRQQPQQHNLASFDFVDLKEDG